MRQHVTNVDVSHRVENDRNQPAVVPFDVEDHAIAVHIRVAKGAAHVREISPIGAARHLVPFYHRTAFVVEENEALSSRFRLSQSDSSFLAAEWLCGLDPAAWAGWLAEIAAVVGSSFTPS